MHKVSGASATLLINLTVAIGFNRDGFVSAILYTLNHSVRMGLFV